MKSNDISPKNTSAQPSHAALIVTRGEAVIKVTPDQAWLSITIETRDEKAEKARESNAKSMILVQETLRNVGLIADAIRTTQFTLSPEMEWRNGRNIMKGYLVRNQIQVRVDDLNHLSNVIDSVNATGNTTLMISSLHFTLKNQQEIEKEALKLSVQSALVRAQAIASGANQTLGRIVQIEEPNLERLTRAEPYVMHATMAKGDAHIETPLTVDDVEVRAKVILTAEMRSP